MMTLHINSCKQYIEELKKKIQYKTEFDVTYL